MQALPRQKILPRKKSGKYANKESEDSNKTTDNTGSVSIRSSRFPSLRRIERRCVIFSAKYQQHEHAGDDRQDRDWDTKARIIPEADFQMFARRFHYDHVGDGANDGEIASKCRRQREHFPHQDRFGKARDPFSRTSTNGTFEKMFDPAMENHVKFQACAATLDPKTGCR